MNKKSVIIQMFNGQKGSFDNIICSKEYMNILNEVADIESEFTKKLKKSELLDSYKNVSECISRLHLQELEDVFIESFKFGVLLGIEVASEE